MSKYTDLDKNINYMSFVLAIASFLLIFTFIFFKSVNIESLCWEWEGRLYERHYNYSSDFSISTSNFSIPSLIYLDSTDKRLDYIQLTIFETTKILDKYSFADSRKIDRTNGYMKVSLWYNDKNRFFDKKEIEFIPKKCVAYFKIFER